MSHTNLQLILHSRNLCRTWPQTTMTTVCRKRHLESLQSRRKLGDAACEQMFACSDGWYHQLCGWNTQKNLHHFFKNCLKCKLFTFLSPSFAPNSLYSGKAHRFTCSQPQYMYSYESSLENTDTSHMRVKPLQPSDTDSIIQGQNAGRILPGLLAVCYFLLRIYNSLSPQQQ